MSDKTIWDGPKAPDMSPNKKCDGCEKLISIFELRDGVQSVRHKHSTASKVQKKIVAVVSFQHLNDGLADICEKCRTKVIQGMAHGGMFE